MFHAAGVVASDEKAAIAPARGSELMVGSTREDIPGRVKEISGGAGVPVIAAIPTVGHDGGPVPGVSRRSIMHHDPS